MRYAQMEVDSNNIAQARSIFERALAIEYTYIPLWHRYAQVEARARQFSNAAAVLERGCGLLPYESKLWLQSLEFEEIRGNYEKCRTIFERWSAIGVEDAWKHWYRFESRTRPQRDYLERLCRRWIAAYPSSLDAWLALASNSPSDRSQQLYSEAKDTGSLNSEQLLHLEKKLGLAEEKKSEQKAETVISTRNGGDVEMWWATLNLDLPNQGELMQKAINCCSLPSKRYKTMECRKYALLWLRYALAAEKGIVQSSAREAYEQGLSNWDHSIYTSATLWRNYAMYFVRNGQLDLGRKVFGSALRKTLANYQGNNHILHDYIALEKQLLETERVRRLYDILCSSWPYDSSSWIEYARFENRLKDKQRFNKLFEIAISLLQDREEVDLLWKEWAEQTSDCDLSEGRKIWGEAVLKGYDRVDLYSHFAMFELGTGLDGESDDPDQAALDRARAVFENALSSSLADEAMDTTQIFDLFIQMEESYGTPEALDNLLLRLSQFEEEAKASVTETGVDSEGPPIKKIEKLSSSEESASDDEQPAPASAVQKLLANAQKWKMQQG